MSKETDADRRKRELDLQLDRELESTFPGSDALTVTLKDPAPPTATKVPGGKPRKA